MTDTRESIHGDPLEDNGTILAEMTNQLIPDHASPTLKTNPMNLEYLMAEFLAKASVSSFKDKEPAHILGHMFLVMASQLKQKEILLERTTGELQVQREENIALKRALDETQHSLDKAETQIAELKTAQLPTPMGAEEKLFLREKVENLDEDLEKKEKELLETTRELYRTTHKLEKAESLLEHAAGELNLLKTQVRVHATALQAEERHTSMLEYQLRQAQRQVSLCQDQQQETDEKLANAQIKLHHSLQLGRDQREPSDQGFFKERRDTRPLERAFSPTFPTSLDYPLQHRNRTFLDPGKSPPSQRSYSFFDDPSSPCPSDRDLDKIARNIARFEPSHQGTHDAEVYLKDIDFYLRRYPGATIDDKIYLIKATSSREVSNFLERQPSHIRNDYGALCQALICEFTDPLTSAGLLAAFTVKQERSEPPNQYYTRLRQAYFGSKNEPGMEEDQDFKALFVQNLHPTVSHHLGVAACPKTLTSRQLRELAVKGFAKQKQITAKKAEPSSIWALEAKFPPRKLEGVSHGNLSHANETRTERPKDFKPCWPKRSGHTPTYHQTPWLTKGRNPSKFGPKSLPRKPRCFGTPSRKHQPYKGGVRHEGPDRYDPHFCRQRSTNSPSTPSSVKEMKSHEYPDSSEESHRSEEDSIESRLTEEELDALIKLIQKVRQQRDRKLDLLPISTTDSDLSFHHDSLVQNDKEETDPFTSVPESETLMMPDLARELNVSQITLTSDPSVDDQAIVKVGPSFCQFLGNLTEKGNAQKFYLDITLERELDQEALLDTAADITLMSAALFHRLRARVKKSNRDLELLPCDLDVQPYTLRSTTFTNMTMLDLTIGPMHLVHPVYISPLESVPFLIGKDLLNRFDPLIDFKRLRIWSQVPKPLPVSCSQINTAQCFTLTQPPTCDNQATFDLGDVAQTPENSNTPETTPEIEFDSVTQVDQSVVVTNALQKTEEHRNLNDVLNENQTSFANDFLLALKMRPLPFGLKGVSKDYLLKPNQIPAEKSAWDSKSLYPQRTDHAPTHKPPWFVNF